MIQRSQYLAISEMSCSATRTVMSLRTIARRYSMTLSLNFISKWDVGSSTSISLGFWTYALAINTLCSSPDDSMLICLFCRCLTPNFSMASITSDSSSLVSHQRFFRYG